MTPFPEQATIIFSGAAQADKIEPLRQRQAEAAMVSFDFFKSPKRWEVFHSTIVPLFDWPVRLYLDSGIYTLMRKAGVARAKVHLDKDRDNDERRFYQTEDEKKVAFEKLANAYLDYLSQYHHRWQHIVELDVDNIFGLEVTRIWRRKLKAIVGDKLMPVWHESGGQKSWSELIEEFQYVGIGGDAGVGMVSLRDDNDLARYRAMVDHAHECGVAVQGFGDTRLKTFSKTHWDSADSTSWLTSQKYGQVGHLKVSEKYSTAHTAQGFAKVPSWMDWAREHGIDPQRVIVAGTTIEKLLCWIVLLQYRQAQVREIYADQGVHVWQPEQREQSLQPLVSLSS